MHVGSTPDIAKEIRRIMRRQTLHITFSFQMFLSFVLCRHDLQTTVLDQKCFLDSCLWFIIDKKVGIIYKNNYLCHCKQ